MEAASKEDIIKEGVSGIRGSKEVPERQQKELIRKLRIRTILAFRQSMITFSNVV